MCVYIYISLCMYMCMYVYIYIFQNPYYIIQFCIFFWNTSTECNWIHGKMLEYNIRDNLHSIMKMDHPMTYKSHGAHRILPASGRMPVPKSSAGAAAPWTRDLGTISIQKIDDFYGVQEQCVSLLDGYMCIYRKWWESVGIFYIYIQILDPFTIWKYAAIVWLEYM